MLDWFQASLWRCVYGFYLAEERVSSFVPWHLGLDLGIKKQKPVWARFGHCSEIGLTPLDLSVLWFFYPETKRNLPCIHWVSPTSRLCAERWKTLHVQGVWTSRWHCLMGREVGGCSHVWATGTAQAACSQEVESIAWCFITFPKAAPRQNQPPVRSLLGPRWIQKDTTTPPS